MLLLREDEVRSLLTMEQTIGLMEDALRAFSSGGVVQPVRQVVAAERHRGFLGLMPAYMVGQEALGAKAVAFYPLNARRQLPTHLAVILLWESDTGRPLALMDGRLITEIRTAAVSAAATRALARSDAHTLAILGAGVQARSHVEALPLVRELEQVRVWSRTEARAQTFAEEMQWRVRVAIEACATPERAVRGADIIVTATSSQTPVLQGPWVAPGAHINAVGAARPDWRELDNDAIRRARIFVDSRAGALTEAGDIILAMREAAISEGSIVGEIGEVFAGAVPGRTSEADITLFKSLGMAVEDVATANYVYAQARKRGVGREIELD